MEKNYLTDTDIAELIRASAALKPNETVSGYISEEKKRREWGSVMVSVFRREEIVKTPPKKHNLIKESACSIILKALEKLEYLATREDDLNKIYRDNKGRDYYYEEGIRTYIDSRGFNYYLKYIPDLEREFAYVRLSDEFGNVTFATFINEERTLIQIDGKVFPMNDKGEIIYEEEVPYLGPKL